MTTDSGSGSIVAVAGSMIAMLTPLGLAATWLLNYGRKGSEGTISSQAALLVTLQKTVDAQAERQQELTERLDKLSVQLDSREDEIDVLRKRVRVLERQLEQAGIAPMP